MIKKTTGLMTVALVVAAGLPLSALAEAPFDFDKASGRLPKNVVPMDYAIAVVPDVAAKTFTGTESVSLNFREAADTVTFNTLNLKLRDVHLDGKPVKSVATDNDQQLTTAADAYLAGRASHA